MNKKLLVTGANGYVGRALVARLAAHAGWETSGSVRRSNIALPAGVRSAMVGDLGPATDWRHALDGVDCVIHTAGRAHVIERASPQASAAFRTANVDGALNLAQQAAQAGVKRFIFISSIGVNGGETFSTPFSETTPPQPHAAYADSKFEAEEALKPLSAQAGMELTIIRPPLVYNYDAPGNFARLLKMVAKGWILPFASVNNRRSMVSLENLVDFLHFCVDSPAVANQTFVVADGVDVSLPEMIGLLSAGMGRPARMVPIPPQVLKAGAALLGRPGIFKQLCGSLQVDISKALATGWVPPSSAQDALRRAGKEFRER